MKKILLLFVGFFVFGLSACTSNVDDTVKPVNDKIDDVVDDNENTLLKLTLEELAMYDGKDGMDAYIAVNGIIYDVTGNSAWTNGTHQGNVAGTDVSEVINNAPHGDAVLDDLNVIGEIVE